MAAQTHYPSSQTHYDPSRDLWHATPSSSAALVGVAIPYRPPRAPLAAFLWRKRMLVETTTGLMLLEPWEKLLMMSLMLLLLSLFATAVVTVLPQSLALVERRTAYYLFGHEPAASAGAVSRLLAGLVGADNATCEL